MTSFKAKEISRVLVVGQGAREHALLWSIHRAHPHLEFFAYPGNAGMEALATRVPGKLSDIPRIVSLVEEKEIDLVVVGPEQPLAQGLRDQIEAQRGSRTRVIGPSRQAALLEASKAWAKQLMQEAGIPTARFEIVDEDTLADANRILDAFHPPYVLKADGLAGGKGVLIASTREEALQLLHKMIRERMFGEASRRVVIEDFLSGREASLFAWVRNGAYFILPTAQDYKRLYEGNTGPNTGGMGAVSPGWLTRFHVGKVREKILEPLMDILERRDISYEGFLYIGLMFVDDEPYVLEFNVRLGDPEAQVILPRLEGSWLDLWVDDRFQLHETRDVAVGVVLASEGYPSGYQTGFEIDGLETLQDQSSLLVFHAGTERRTPDNAIITAGGRVLTVVGLGRTLEDARIRAYEGVEKIQFFNKYYRPDIARDLLETSENTL